MNLFNNCNNKHAKQNAGQLNSLTHTRALLVLHDRGILSSPHKNASLGIFSPTDVNQTEMETLKGGLQC